MGNPRDSDTQLATRPAQPDTTDRRRPGRPQNVAPALLPLLRAPHGPTGALSIEAEPSPSVTDDDGREDYSLFRGICTGLVLVSPFWAAVLYLVFR